MARIAIISDGQGVHAYRSIEALVELGHEVHWIPTRAPSRETQAYVHMGLQPVGPRPALGQVRLLENAAMVRRLLAHIRPDVVQAHFLTPCGWYAFASGFRPYSVHLWGSDILAHRAQPAHYRLFSYFALRGAASVTADSENLIRLAQEVCPASIAGPVLSWGVDTRLFRPLAAPERTELRRRFRIEGEFVWLSTRNFKPEMNVPQLVRAFAALAPAIRDCSTLILKKGFPIDFPAAEVRAAVDETGIAERVLILEDEWRYEDMAALYQCADVFLSIPNSGQDGLSQSLLDAVACGCVPVTSRNEATEELIAPGRVSGIVVNDPHAREELVAALESAIVRASQDRQACAANRVYLQTRFDRSLCVKKLGAHVRALTGHSRAGDILETECY